ncbi:MAG: peptidylprolyl isomerase [Polyangiaceae bacterium]|nr:peptidylprolyl isomerase [Polyangiaceae bacterium]MCE7892303.1 peptidylprolyl isomerase [Sorangiineae bacterium PRO1]MCL4749895.1 peptidylprolyl isomerase [Myxococcales bacterium]
MRRSFLSASLVALALACQSQGSSTKKPFPGPEQATLEAPAEYKVRFTTSRGAFVVRVVRDWSPNGAARFYNLVKLGFYDGSRFFRVVPGFVAQWGIHADGEPVMGRWRNAKFPDDPVKESNARGRLSFAMAGPASRTTQVFVNLGDNARLDAMGFAPFAEVVEGLDVVLALSSAHGQKPDQAKIQREGNAYLDREFPGLDSITRAEIVP